MLRVDELDCARGGRRILEGISFQLNAGEVLAVLGTNGAGKSTLLASLTGELAPLSGSVEVAGQALGSWSAQERARRMAVLPQSSSLAFPFSVAEVVAMGRLPHATGRHQDELIIDQALEATDVVQLRERSYLSLSGANDSACTWRACWRRYGARQIRAVCCSMSQRRRWTSLINS